MQIGTIPCSAPTCADDVSLIADSEKKLQILIDTVVVDKLLGLVHSSHVTQLPRDYTICAWIFPYFLGFV
jgi:hypothetical protein